MPRLVQMGHSGEGDALRSRSLHAIRPSKEGFPALPHRPTLRPRGRGCCGLASSADNREEHDRSGHRPVCLACGKPLPGSLFSRGSLRCSDCRRSNERLDEDLVDRWLAHGGPLH